MSNREAQGYEKLSRLQKFIMVALLEPKYADMPRREFSQFVYKTWFQEDSPSSRASLSRTYRLLEDRVMIMRAVGRWQLTPPPNGFGLFMAAEIWDDNRAGYKQLFDLNGPPLPEDKSL